MGVRENILVRLREVFEPESLDLVDISHLHRDHAGWKEGGETHFRLRIGATRLAKKSRLEQHRTIMAALSGEFEAGLHALTIEVVTEEPESSR